MSAALDSHMSPHSYGFRPNRTAHDAVKAAGDHVAQGKTWVVDIDLKSFFDTIDHKWMMQFLAYRIADRRILRLIGK